MRRSPIDSPSTPSTVRWLRLLVLAPIGFIAVFVVLPFRVWWRARRTGASFRNTLEAIGAEAYDKLPPEWRAEIDAERRKSN
jgi:hypothetical protein